MRVLVREATGYAIASVAALLVDFGLLWTLVRFARCPYLAAATISFLAGASVAYALSIKIAFKSHRLRDRRVEFALFVALGAAALLVNVAVLYVLVDRFSVNYLTAKGVAAGCTFTCNFLLRRQALFVR